MRVIYGCLAVLLGGVSIALAARYGFKGADSQIDGAISGVMFGAIALCAFLFHAGAVRLWFLKHYGWSIVVGLVGAAALIVTITNSLGAIAGRADITQAERIKTKNDVKADTAALERITDQRARLVYTPTTDAVVVAAAATVEATEQARKRECGTGDPRERGPICKKREDAALAARSAHGTAVADKASTEQAAKLDAEAAELRRKLGKAPPVQFANPLGTTLELILGVAAAALTAWQQAIVAVVFELCLVTIMVMFELLGLKKAALADVADIVTASGKPATQEPPPLPPSVSVPTTHRKAKPPAADKATLSKFLHDHLFPADGQRVEFKTLANDYRAWCQGNGVAPVTRERFMREIEKLCGKLGIKIEVGSDQRVYCMDVTLANAAPGADTSFH